MLQVDTVIGGEGGAGGLNVRITHVHTHAECQSGDRPTDKSTPGKSKRIEFIINILIKCYPFAGAVCAKIAHLIVVREHNNGECECVTYWLVIYYDINNCSDVSARATADYKIIISGLIKASRPNALVFMHFDYRCVFCCWYCWSCLRARLIDLSFYLKSICGQNNY